MERDQRVMVLGQDVGRLGGVFRATAGIQERFGGDRCFDTPVSEAGMLGTAVGLALAGWRPVCEIQFDGFCYPALDQLITHVGRYRQRTSGRAAMPLVVRIPYGGGVGAPELHSDSPEAYFVHAPGLKVAVPSSAADAKGLLAAAIRSPDPVVFLEPKALYRVAQDPVPEGDHCLTLGTARIARRGDAVTIITYGAMVPVAQVAAQALAEEGMEAEVIDLRTLKPLDEELVIASVAKTGRAVVVHEGPRTLGVGAEVSALLAEHAIASIKGPIVRVTGYDSPAPPSLLEHKYIPSPERVIAAARRTMEL